VSQSARPPRLASIPQYQLADDHLACSGSAFTDVLVKNAHSVGDNCNQSCSLSTRHLPKAIGSRHSIISSFWTKICRKVA